MARVKRVKSFELKGVTITKDVLKLKLSTNLLWAVNGLLKIYSFQTEEEKYKGHTVRDNGRGFSGVDSKILSSFSELVLAKRKDDPKSYSLSPKQKEILFRLMPKYSNQLFSILLEESLING